MRKELEEALQKKAVFDGPEWQNWMMRKDVIDPSNMQHLRSQDNGYLTSFLASTALGGGLGLLGDQLTGGNHTKGSVLGGAASGAGLAMLANLVGKGAGYVTPTRTKAKHDKYQNSGTAAEWLIPGVANYNKVKTYGYSLHGREKNKEAEPKENEQKKAASLQKKAENDPVNVSGELVMVPGGGSYRLLRRRLKELENDKGDAPHFVSQGVGPGTSLLATTGVGAGAGAALAALLAGKGDRGRMAGVGAGIGAISGIAPWLLGEAIAPVAAAIKKRRTKEEQQAYANSGTLKEYLVPGVASYNAYKTLGRALESDESVAKDEGEKKTAAAAFGAIPAIGNALSPAPAPATIAKPQQQAATAQNQQQQAQNQAGEQAPQADTNTIADLTASLNKITDVAKNSIKPSEQNTVAQNNGGESAQAEAVSGALKAASARYTKIASDRKRDIIYGIINKVMK